MKGAVWREEDRTPSSSSLVLSLEPAQSRVSDWRGSGGGGRGSAQVSSITQRQPGQRLRSPGRGDLPRSAQAEALGNTD